MLNYSLAGVHRGRFLLWGANIGHGKTTTSVIQLVMPSLINGVNTLIASNEQGISEFRQIILGTALFNHFKAPAGMNRHKIMTGSYTDEQKKGLKDAADWIKQQKGKIDFAELTSYDANSLTKLIRKYSRLGYTMFIIDTLKPSNDSNDKMWGEFSEVSKELSLLAKNLNVAIVCTFQLTPDSQTRKYLDLTCIGKSRAIAETAHAVIMFRHIHSDEYERLKPFTYTKNEDGTRSKTEVELDDNKSYIMVFMPKNRSGNTAPQIVMEFDMNFLRMSDVGYYNQSPENYRR
jgi:replicative DNA helicase